MSRGWALRTVLGHRTARRLASARLVLATFLATAPGCHHPPSPHAACRFPGQVVCAGADRALACTAGAWVELPCRGPAGCLHHDGADECDDTVARDGDACPSDPPVDYACSADHAEALVCREGRFSIWRPCRGPEHCQIAEGHTLRCDTTLGRPGDPCGQSGACSCAEDGQAMLACDGRTLAIATTCLGPEGCRVERDAHKVDCDDSLAREGDACRQARRLACSVDRKSELVCEGNAYAKRRDCRRSDCRLENTELFCD